MLEEKQKRQIAYKVRIKELINGKYIKEEGWQPNYIITEDGRRINRINLIATVVAKPVEHDINYQTIILDDGTGRISVRNFEQNKMFDQIGIGDVILLIGRPREYGNEKYILPETIKKIQNKAWIKVRELELKNNRPIKKQKIIEKTAEEEIVEDLEESAADKIIRIIKELDQGDGVDFEEILKQIDDEETIKELLKKGELFEIRLGRLKVLE